MPRCIADVVVNLGPQYGNDDGAGQYWAAGQGERRDASLRCGDSPDDVEDARHDGAGYVEWRREGDARLREERRLAAGREKSW